MIPKIILWFLASQEDVSVNLWEVGNFSFTFLKNSGSLLQS